MRNNLSIFTMAREHWAVGAVLAAAVLIAVVMREKGDAGGKIGPLLSPAFMGRFQHRGVFIHLNNFL